MNVNSNEIGNLDTYIEQLLTCKPLKESDVKFLCEKVKEIKYNIIITIHSYINYINRRKRYSKKKATFSQSKPLSQFAETFMDSSTILWNYSKSEEKPRIQTTYSWGTTLTEGTTLSKP